MGGKHCGRTKLVRACADLFAAVTAVFRCQNQLLQERVVVAFRPAIVSLGLQKQQLFSRQRRLLVGLIKVGPIRTQLVSSMLSHKYAPGWVNGETFSVADSRCEAVSR